MTPLNPTSLPPMVIETRLVAELSEETWPESTSEVVAPEQATKVKDEGE
jgi:hypothetical protein